MTLKRSQFLHLPTLLIAVLGQSPIFTSARLFVLIEQDWRTESVFDDASFADGQSAVSVTAPVRSAVIWIRVLQQGTAPAEPAASTGGLQHTHFDATSGHDTAMTLKRSPLLHLATVLIAVMGQLQLFTSARLFLLIAQDWRTESVFDGPSFADGQLAVSVTAPALWRSSGFLSGIKGLLPLNRLAQGGVISAGIWTPLRATTP